jgi:two-component system, cell cycle sensor histidine kinase and response regulator CckA
MRADMYGIVKQNGGNIWVYSEPERGSTFKVYFPRVREPEEKTGSRTSSPESLNGTETILLAEDEEGVRSLVYRTLQGCGYRVLVAKDADDAINIFEDCNEQIHLLVTDVVMPQMNGNELAKRLSLHHPETEVLYMSGYTDNAIVHHGVLEAGTFFIQKPFMPRILMKKVREVLDSRSKIAGNIPPLT